MAMETRSFLLSRTYTLQPCDSPKSRLAQSQWVSLQAFLTLSSRASSQMTRYHGTRRRTSDSCISASSSAVWVSRWPPVSTRPLSEPSSSLLPGISVRQYYLKTISLFPNADSFIVFTDGAKDASGNPVISPALLGFVSSCYQLGSIIGVPIAPWVSQRFGRRWSIMGGSLIMCVGALIQGFSHNRKSLRKSVVNYS